MISLEFISVLINGAEALGLGDDIGLNEGSGEEGLENVPVVLNVAKEGFGPGGMKVRVEWRNAGDTVDCFDAGFRGRGLFLISKPVDVEGDLMEERVEGTGKEGVAGFSKGENLTPFDGAGMDFWKI